MRSFIMASAVFLSATVSADWQLSEPSHIHFLSTKNTHKTEVHEFKRLTGSVTKDGKATLIVDLTSVETGIPIRNERMQEFLFETPKFATATFTAQIPADMMSKANVGSLESLDLSGVLSLHGKEVPIQLPVFISPVSDGSVVVSSALPILIQANQFDLVTGIQKLREMAGLERISEVVPVTFTLTFKPE
ncbi:YceI family protein [Thalassolituus sp.]|uniref:YceI family protein n=1 Tax=Thalassolituus sp. TaxID=2030822 RepID=UPI002A815323|nr:YceI family protein [Thalassolituus sp.]